MAVTLMSRLVPRVEHLVRKWREEIPSLPASFFGEPADEEGLSDSVLLPLILGCVLTGLVGGFLVGMESAQPPSTVVQTSFEAGYEDGFSDGMRSLPESQPEVLFRQDGLFNRSIAIVYPEQNLSYECVVSRRTLEDGGGEWAIDRQAYKYNGTVDCSAIEENLVPVYNSPEINDTLLRNEVAGRN